MDIQNLCDDWAFQTQRRNNYKFANEKVHLDTFAELVKETFEALKTVKNQYLYNSAYPENPYLTFEYLRLVSEISQYSTYDYDGDESEDYKFTATCLVAQALVRYAIYMDGAMHDENGVKFFDSEETLSGELVILRLDYPYFTDEFYDDTYIYNVYKGDFSEVLRLAEDLAG